MEQDSNNSSSSSSSSSNSNSSNSKKSQRKARPCHLCGEEFLYLKIHLMGSKHGLSKELATQAIYQAKTSTKPRLPCPFAACRDKGVMVQRLKRHLQNVHGLTGEEAKTLKSAGLEDVEEEEEEENDLAPSEAEATEMQHHQPDEVIDQKPTASTASKDNNSSVEAPPLEPQEPDDECQEPTPSTSSKDSSLGDEDKATLEKFQSHLTSLDGGSHPLHSASQSARAVGRMAASAGGLRAMVSQPTLLTEEEGFLTVSTRHKAPGTVRTYLQALKQFADFALSGRDLYPQQDVEHLTRKVRMWQTSLRKLARPHDQERRLRDERKVEELLTEPEETDDAREGKNILLSASTDQQQEATSFSRTQFHLARDYLMSRLVKNNGARSGNVINLTWRDVESKREEEGHHVVRTYNKTMGTYGMANLVLDDEEYLMLKKYRTIQSQVVSTEVEHVFTTHRGDPLQSNSVSRALERTMGTHATATLMRKVKVVSWSTEGRDLGKLGRHMKHSPETQRKHYFTYQDTANSVEVYREGKKVRSKWTQEEEAVLRRNMVEYIIAGGVRKVTVETILQQSPEMQQLGQKFCAKQIQDKVRNLHNRDNQVNQR